MEDISNDMLGNIMSRLDATALASVACTCSHLHELALHPSHWSRLCHSTWPSTQLQQADGLLPSSVAGGFVGFYTSSLPLIACNQEAAPPPETADVHASSPSDLVSFVDVFVNNKCVLSRVLHGIPEAVEADSGRQRWFMSCPFRWDCIEEVYPADLDQASGDYLLPLDAVRDNPCREDRSQELTESLRLSWILMEKKSGKPVNLSSWKPTSVQRSWPYDGSYLAQFGCVVPVQTSVLPHKLARCSITTKFKMTSSCLEPEGSFFCRELSLVVEDMDGTQVSGDRSLKVLSQALYSERSINKRKVEEGYSQYEEAKNKFFKQKEFAEKLANRLYMLIEIAAFLSCSFTLKSLF